MDISRRYLECPRLASLCLLAARCGYVARWYLLSTGLVSRVGVALSHRKQVSRLAIHDASAGYAYVLTLGIVGRPERLCQRPFYNESSAKTAILDALQG